MERDRGVTSTNTVLVSLSSRLESAESRDPKRLRLRMAAGQLYDMAVRQPIKPLVAG